MGPRGIASLVAMVAVAAGVAAPAQAQAAAGKGTAESAVTGARLALSAAGDEHSVALVLMESSATLDKERRSLPRNHATGTLTAARVDLGPAGVVSVPPDPIQVSRDEATTGSDRRGENLAVSFNVPGDVSASEVGATDPSVANLLTDIEGVRSLDVANGLVAKGSARPLNLEALFGVAGAGVTGGSTVDAVEAIGGLVKLDNLSLTDQEASASPDIVRSAVRELSVDAITVLDVNGLLGLLGLDMGEIPLGTLAKMADELGLPVSGTLGSTPVSDFGSWAGASQALIDTRNELATQTGTACNALPGTLTGLLGSVGVSCSGTVQQALDTVDSLLTDLLDIVQGAVYGAPFVSVEDLTASVQAVAAVTPEGVAETSAAAVGSIGSVKIGGNACGALAADLTTSTLAGLQAAWNELRARCNALIDTVLGALGDAFRGLVDAVPVPVAVQTTKVDGEYAVAEARLSLLQVKVSLPGSLPDPLDLGAVGGGGGTTTTTLPPVTTTLPTLPVPTTVTLPTLPIAFVRDAAVRPQVSTLATTATVEVGVLSASAEHTRPGVTITSGGENRTWNARTGFGGPLPRTGAGSGTWPLALFAVLAATAVGLNRLAGGRVRRLTR